MTLTPAQIARKLATKNLLDVALIWNDNNLGPEINFAHNAPDHRDLEGLDAEEKNKKLKNIKPSDKFFYVKNRRFWGFSDLKKSPIDIKLLVDFIIKNNIDI